MMKNDKGWWFQAVEGFCWWTDGQTDEQTDICDCRVAFATENRWKQAEKLKSCKMVKDEGSMIKNEDHSDLWTILRNFQ